VFTSGFGEVLKLEHLAKQSAVPALSAILPSLTSQVNSWKQLYTDILGVDMEHVWAGK